MYGDLTNNGLGWDSAVEPFTNTADSTVIETESNEFGNNQLIREIALKEAVDLNGFLNRVKNTPDIEDKDTMVEDKINALKTDAMEWDRRSKAENEKGDERKALLYRRIRDIELESARYIGLSYFNTDLPDKDINNDVTRYYRFKCYITENFGEFAIFSSLIIAIAGLVIGLILKSRSVIRKSAIAAYDGSKFLMDLAKSLGTIVRPILKIMSKFLSYFGNIFWDGFQKICGSFWCL